MKKMIADYMETGFLENIIDMFKHDRRLFPLISDLMGDDRGRVRLGTVALVESMIHTHYSDILTSLTGIFNLLKHPNPTIRGDAAYLLGIIGHPDALPHLYNALNNSKEDKLVVEAIKESIESIRENNNESPDGSNPGAQM
jgi:hypothetical protein